MGLSRLDNFLKSTRGTIIYVDPNAIDSTDAIENQGNSLGRPFKTIQRALIEASRFSYQRGLDNDRFNKTTIVLYPGEHIIDNRPGWIPDGASNYRLRSGSTSSEFGEFSTTTDFNLLSADNSLYKLNSVRGGVIVPRGTSIVGMDLRKTKIRPLYVPNPENDQIERSAIFRITGACYFWQFTILDSDPNSVCYKDYTTNLFVPNFSHHKLTGFEYADGVNDVKISDDFQTFETARTDLDIYYEKIGIAYGNSSGRPITPDYPSDEDIQPVIDEYRIVGSRGAAVGISSIKSGDGSSGNTTITVTTTDSFPQLSVDSPIQISGVNALGYNGQFVVSSVTSSSQFTYKVQNIPTNLLPSVSGSNVSLAVDTVTSASPYIFNISMRSVFGMCGMLADGSKADGFKSMVVAQYTGIGLQKDDKAFVKYDTNSGSYQDFTSVSNLHTDSLARYKPSYESYHVRAINESYIQIVSVFAIGYSNHFQVESGGDFSINNSNSNFGAKAFQAMGFRHDAFTKDGLGYITHIVTPKERDVNKIPVNFLPIDYSKTVSVGDTTKLYLYGYNSQESAPPEVVEGFRIGAQSNDILYLDIAQSGVTTTYSARVVMPNTQLSAEKKYYVGRAAGINSITSSLITLTSKHELINGETIRVISETGQLPDGLDPDNIYYTITDTASVGIGSNQIKVAKTLNDATNNNPITINSRGGTLKIVSRVSDKVSGYIGHPIGFDTSNSQWFIKVAIAASENSIYPTLASSVLYNSTARTYFKRTLDTRDSSDTIYKVRYVIPNDAVNLGSDPIEGYILQESNNVIGAGTTEIQKYFSPTAATLSNSTELKNFRFISDANWTGGVVSINTELPHDLRIGAQVEVLNVVSTANTTGIASTAFNGTFTVTGITSVRQFTYSTTNNPGTFTGVTTNRTSSLPHFKKKQLATSYQIYKSEEIQKYVQNIQDGVYYLTLINYGNVPSVDPFTNLKFGQPVDKLYPQINRDSAVSDPNSANTFANSFVIGQVDIDDSQNSITKQTEEKRQYDFGGVIAINNIRSASGTAHTIYAPYGHGLSGITSVSITNAGAGYTSGTFYAVPLGLSTTGRSANARVTVSVAGTITNVRIMDGGGSYKVGDVVNVLSGIGTYSPFTQASVTVTKIYDHVGESIRVSGVTSEGYSGYNTLYKITGISTYNQIDVQSSREVIGIGSDLSVQAANAQAVLTGKTLGISTFTYYAQSGIGTLTFTSAHGLRKNGKVRISGADQVLFNNDFIVTEIKSNTSVSINVGITSSSPSTGGNIVVYLPSLTSYGGEIFGENFVHIINPKENESSTGRLLTQYAGITTTLGSQILASDSDSTPVVISNADILGFKIGDYFQVTDEIFRIKETVLGSALLVYRALFGTPRQDHTVGTALKKIRITPVELRRNSIIRASAHTFEYLGFGPGNYSTAFPDRQDRVLTNKELELSRSTKLDGGAVLYSGLDDRGEFHNAKDYDIPVETITGEQQDISPNKKIQTFDSPIVLNTKLTSNDDIEVKSLFITGDADVSRKFTVGIGTTPAVAGTSGDVVYKAKPAHNEYLGWIYTVDNQWEPFGFIGTLPNGLVFGSANQILYKSPTNTNTGTPEFLFKDNTTLIIGAATSTGFDSQKLQITGNAYISSAIGVGTTASRSALDVIGNARISGIVTIGSASITLNGNANIINVGITSISSGIITATSGIVTYYGDGQYITNLPTGSQWTGVSAGLGTGIYRNGNVGIGTTLTPVRLNVVTGVSTSVDGGLARFLAPNLAVSSSAGIAIGKTFGTDNFQSVLLTYNYQGSSASSGSYLSFAHAGQGNTLVIADNDCVGMGTATPQSKHHVVGNSRVDGTLTVNGNATVSTGSSFIGAGTIPVGGIIMWSGSVASVPTGWALCDGTSGTPDLRNRFIVGAGSAYSPGNSGGSDGVTLTVDQIPSHSHSGSSVSAGTHLHTASSSASSAVSDPSHYHIYPGDDQLNQANGYAGWTTRSAGNFTYDATSTTSSSGAQMWYTTDAVTGITVATSVSTTINNAGAHDHTITVGNTGGGQSHENRPPYYALALIMRTV